MSKDLKPCPFCGNENVKVYNSSDARYRQYNVKCKKCGARICKSTLSEAIEAWNTRAERTCHKGSGWYCEECEQTCRRLRMNYCPNCGAVMER